MLGTNSRKIGNFPNDLELIWKDFQRGWKIPKWLESIPKYLENFLIIWNYCKSFKPFNLMLNFSWSTISIRWVLLECVDRFRTVSENSIYWRQLHDMLHVALMLKIMAHSIIYNCVLSYTIPDNIIAIFAAFLMRFIFTKQRSKGINLVINKVLHFVIINCIL